MRLPAEIRERPREQRVSQGEIGVELGRSQFWVSLVERGQIALDEAKGERIMLAIDRIVERRKVISEATARAVTDFENRKLPADVGRRFAVANPRTPNVQGESPGQKRKSLRTILLPNSSPVPNWFFDELLSNSEVPHATRSVFLFMLRKTVGWDNEVEELSLTAIQYGSAVSRHTAIHAIRVICECWGLFKKSRGQKGQGSSVYRIAGLSEDEFADRSSPCENIYGTCHPTAKQLRERPCTPESLTAQIAINEANEAKRHAEYLKRRSAMTAPQ